MLDFFTRLHHLSVSNNLLGAPVDWSVCVCAGGQVVTHPFQVQQVQQLLHRQKQQAAAQAAAVQKAAQPQQTQAAVQQKVPISQCDLFF